MGTEKSDGKYKTRVEMEEEEDEKFEKLIEGASVEEARVTLNKEDKKYNNREEARDALKGQKPTDVLIPKTKVALEADKEFQKAAMKRLITFIGNNQDLVRTDFVVTYDFAKYALGGESYSYELARKFTKGVADNWEAIKKLIKKLKDKAKKFGRTMADTMGGFVSTVGYVLKEVMVTISKLVDGFFDVPSKIVVS